MLRAWPSLDFISLRSDRHPQSYPLQRSRLDRRARSLVDSRLAPHCEVERPLTERSFTTSNGLGSDPMLPVKGCTLNGRNAAGTIIGTQPANSTCGRCT